MTGKTTAPQRVSSLSRFKLIHLAVILIILGLAIGAWFVGDELLVIHEVNTQVSQISRFDEAVDSFAQKYNGLPGDLLAITAEREGLPAGNGTPGHGDGDGKISPCNLGWQWHLGCETALFWAHLYASGMISDNFSADARFANDRLYKVGALSPYLPESPIAEGVFVAVWNSDASLPAPSPRLPYGNYYEISRIKGIINEKMTDDSKALTPAQALLIDSKMDDGLPFTGRIVVNGEANWPKDAWGSYAKAGAHNCVSLSEKYNVKYLLQAKTPLCHLAVKLDCCDKK